MDQRDIRTDALLHVASSLRRSRIYNLTISEADEKAFLAGDFFGRSSRLRFRDSLFGSFRHWWDSCADGQARFGVSPPLRAA